MTIAKVNTTLQDYLFWAIGELDDTLLDFSFNLPNKKWVESSTSSDNWVNLYLLEVKENLELRDNKWERRYVDGQVVESKKPLFLDLYYLITFYNKEKNSIYENSYLESVLLALFDFSNLAGDAGISKEVQDELTLEIFPKPYIDDNLGFQLWTALDQDARPFIPLKVTIPLTSNVQRGNKIVKSKEFTYLQDKTLYRVEGLVVDSLNTLPIVNALVTVTKDGEEIDSVETDNRGQFQFQKLRDEKLNLRVEVTGYKVNNRALADIAKLSKSKIGIVLEKE